MNHSEQTATRLNGSWVLHDKESVTELFDNTFKTYNSPVNHSERTGTRIRPLNGSWVLHDKESVKELFDNTFKIHNSPVNHSERSPLNGSCVLHDKEECKRAVRQHVQNLQITCNERTALAKAQVTLDLSQNKGCHKTRADDWLFIGQTTRARWRY